MTRTHDTGGYNPSFIWAYITEYNELKPGKRIIWVIEGHCVPYGTVKPFEGIIDDFGTIVKKP